MSYYNNLLSIPILVIFVCATGELTVLISSFDLQHPLIFKSIALILLSSLLGFSLSISAFALNKLISATSMMVVNNVNKFSIIVLSEIFIKSTLNIVASMGAVSVICFGWLYFQTTRAISRTPLIIAAIVFIILGAVIEYKYINSIIADNGYYTQFDSIITYNPMLDKFSIKEEQIIITMKKVKGDEVYRSYLPVSNSRATFGRICPKIVVKKITEFQLPHHCLYKNASIWKTCKTSYCKPRIGAVNVNYPRRTVTGEKTGDFINRVLEIAWGSNPPSVDLYLRSGCNGIMEMKYLFESIEIFWPRFLGSIIIVLDAGDERILEYLLPRRPTHHYVIAFEYTPCLPGRIFNQYSYLNLDRHSSADYVVTIDSDCIFHSPVTPDLIFRQGKVILPSSRTFQKEMWVKPLNSIMGAGMYDGHYMVTQPVTFSLSTFSSFRQWFNESKGKCYEDQIVQLSPNYYQEFCWMCQLGTYLERGHPQKSEYEKYWFHHLDNETVEPILRYSIHVPYEPYNSKVCQEPKCYEKSMNEVIREGLCRAFGSVIFEFCTKYLHLHYINNVTFSYAHTEIQAADESARTIALTSYLERLSNITMITLDKSMKPKPII
ncbi:unnamed protein product [Adineta steineri]|uniref:Uncharacterized protein n=1 Tax=Adineta steineri TaxID=433720 RepID=A0A819ZN14_9BILA|nr:unnamed protein product [Adineta steineri]CAF4176606.1 unnamed protein product [Adineta steineri]